MEIMLVGSVVVKGEYEIKEIESSHRRMAVASLLGSQSNKCFFGRNERPEILRMSRNGQA